MTSYKVLSGRKTNGRMDSPLVVGHAFQNEGEPYYTIRLRMFPNQSYYLRKNKNSQTAYTVFARRVNCDKSALLKSPVGSGMLRHDFKSHLELNFTLLPVSLFMDLFSGRSE